MVKAEDLDIAKKFIRSVAKHYSVDTVYLFGSFAKGNAHSDSDIDVAVILNQEQLSFEKELELVKLRRDVDLRIEPHAFLKNDFNEDNPIASEILKYGIRLV